MNSLPFLIAEDLIPTRNYLQDVAKVLGSLQLIYLAPTNHDWQYGLEVTMRGLTTQQMTIDSQPVRASLDMVRHKVRIGDTNWSLEEYAAPEILNNIKLWLIPRGQNVKLDQLEFSDEVKNFNSNQAKVYAEALWWLEERFRSVKSGLNRGLTSPILVYPHHFDMALSWFPHNDKKQMSLGFSPGDQNITEPYLYLTLYPESPTFKKLKLPKEAYWQTNGFSGAILPYANLQSSKVPEAVFNDFASLILEA